MRRQREHPRSAGALAAADAAAIILFVTIGLLSHHKGLTLRGYARDTLPLAGGWFLAAAFFHAYRDPRWHVTLATWAVGIPLGVLVRALILGRTLDGSEAAFLGVCLATIGLLVVVFRTALAVAVPKLSRA
jgi:hypothetical protein